MRERLIENWLDSVNERSYQSAFLQMLVGEGHRVIHSTRHMGIEFGKDVISIDPDGVPCAFQLKGNPGSRLTLNQFREIRPQIIELIEQPIVYPGVQNIPHRSILVTNGEVEEEVQRAIEDMNIGLSNRGFSDQSKLSIWSRGSLLDLSLKHSGAFWTENFHIQEMLIRLYNEDGHNTANFDIFSSGFDEILKISGRERLSKAEVRRRQISASLFASFGSRKYAECNNYVAVAGVQAALYAALCASEHRHQFTWGKRGSSTREISRRNFFSTLREFSGHIGNEIIRRKGISNSEREFDINSIFLTENSLADHQLWRPRALKSMSLMSVLKIETLTSKESTPLSNDEDTAISMLTQPNQEATNLWGEAAIPQILAHAWCLRMSGVNFPAMFAEFHIIQTVIRRLNESKDGFIANPYFDAEDVIRTNVHEGVGIESGKARRDTARKSSYTVEGLFHCFVRSNFKSYAKNIWPELTRILHKSFIPGSIPSYCLWRCDEGENIDKQLVHKELWSNVQALSADTATPNVPVALRDDVVMLLAFVIFFPHRAIPEVVRFIQYELVGVWFLPQVRPEPVLRCTKNAVTKSTESMAQPAGPASLSD